MLGGGVPCGVGCFSLIEGLGVFAAIGEGVGFGAWGIRTYVLIRGEKLWEWACISGISMQELSTGGNGATPYE